MLIFPHSHSVFLFKMKSKRCQDKIFGLTHPLLLDGSAHTVHVQQPIVPHINQSSSFSFILSRQWSPQHIIGFHLHQSFALSFRTPTAPSVFFHICQPYLRSSSNSLAWQLQPHHLSTNILYHLHSHRIIFFKLLQKGYYFVEKAWVHTEY